MFCKWTDDCYKSARKIARRFNFFEHDPMTGRKGHPHQRGQLIAFIGKNSFGTSMLYIEFHAGNIRGSLSTPGSDRPQSDIVLIFDNSLCL